MKAEIRREKILEALGDRRDPVSASALAREFSVSRQIVVGDVAILRASGADIAATPRGYLLQSVQPEGEIRRIACIHSIDSMEEELNLCVDYGCSVLDVIVEHPVYGQLTGQLQVNSRYDVSRFMEKAGQEGAHALSELTDGVHLHTLRCPSEEAFDRLCAALREAGFLYEEQGEEYGIH